MRWRDRAIASEIPCPARVVKGSESSCDPHRQWSRAAVRKAHHGLQVRDAFALGDGPYHFFDRNSRSAAASSICLASIFFSFAFSSSSCFSRLASETSVPPPMICSSVNRVASSVRPFSRPDLRGGKSQLQVNFRATCFLCANMHLPHVADGAGRGDPTAVTFYVFRNLEAADFSGGG